MYGRENSQYAIKDADTARRKQTFQIVVYENGNNFCSF